MFWLGFAFPFLNALFSISGEWGNQPTKSIFGLLDAPKSKGGEILLLAVSYCGSARQEEEEEEEEEQEEEQVWRKRRTSWA